MNLRDYQDHCHDRIIEEWQTHRSTLAVLATGLGKTIIFCHVLDTRRTTGRALIIAHRKELIEQAKEKLQQAVGLYAGIEMAGEYADTSWFDREPVVIATVQTLQKRMERFKPQDFSTIVIDEAHHSTSPSYVKVLDYFKQNPNLKILGVTATPDRADEEALSQVYDSVAFKYDIYDGVQDGWLVDITQQFCCVSSLDFSHVRKTAGELNEGDLAKIMEAEENVQGICHPSMEVLYGLTPGTLTDRPVPEWHDYLLNLQKEPRTAIVFTVSVAQAEACSNIFNRVMPGIAEWIWGGTKKTDREEILGRFHKGTTKVIVNCGVLLEGFDCPKVEVILMARPTLSRCLYAQCIGRSTRPLPGLVDSLPDKAARRTAIENSAKPFARIIDFVGNSGRHKLVCAMDILGGKVSDEAKDRAIERAKEDGKPLRVCRSLTNEEIALEREKRERLLAIQRMEEEQRRALVAKANFTQRDVDPFGQTHVFGRHKPRTKPTGPPATVNQMKILSRAGINHWGWTKKQAGMVIGLLATHGWKLPSDPKHDWIRNHGKQVAA